MALVCVSALFATPALAAPGSISGTVVTREGDFPVEEVRVCAWHAAGDEVAECDWTAGDGTYGLEQLEAGGYKVEFWPEDSDEELALQFYDRQSRWDEAEVISLADGEVRTGVDAELPPSSTITGKVFDATHGRPVEGTRVCSIDALTDKLWICTRTNVNGTYALPFHAAGDYKVAFSLELREWFPGAPAEEDGYPTQFWNNETSLAAAFVMSLGTSWWVGAIDARYGAPPVASPPTISPPSVTPPRRKARKCRRGYRKKLVRGKRRCVKIPRKHRRGKHPTAKPMFHRS